MLIKKNDVTHIPKLLSSSFNITFRSVFLLFALRKTYILDITKTMRTLRRDV